MIRKLYFLFFLVLNKKRNLLFPLFCFRCFWLFQRKLMSEELLRKCLFCCDLHIYRILLVKNRREATQSISKILIVGVIFHHSISNQQKYVVMIFLKFYLLMACRNMAALISRNYLQ